MPAEERFEGLAVPGAGGRDKASIWIVADLPPPTALTRPWALI